MFKKLTEIFLFGSIFISCCAVVMCIETNLLLGISLNSVEFYLFVFGATLIQYNLHYLFKTTAINDSKRLAWSLKNKKVHKILIALGVIMVIYGLFSFQLHHFLVLLVLGIISILYSFPLLPFTKKKTDQRFWLIKNIYPGFVVDFGNGLVSCWSIPDFSNCFPIDFF